MGIMIPVYIINASYLGPVGLLIYLRYGRPAKPQKSTPTTREAVEGTSGPSASTAATKPATVSHSCHTSVQTTTLRLQSQSHQSEKQSSSADQETSCHRKSTSNRVRDVEKDLDGDTGILTETGHSQNHFADAQGAHACHATTAQRPYWATVLVGVFHCGAGCVLGDVVGEWLVYGTNASINGHSVWAELLIDYAFALLFGIIFQYLSIAPMSGRWGPMTVARAAKADVLSLTSFEIGAFGWMVAYQVGIWRYEVDMTTWLYWWMMQVGMCLGVATAFPVNWWLLKVGIKEPCC
ncbi:MAG: hypothetical protein M1828_001803 [Chrysothrix sp. TS-e1954]|nr:MAG: hypothetical protein M1828_001803 [Chrysothrix sp. TS-e1954]